MNRKLIVGNWKMNGLKEDSFLRIDKLSHLLRNSSCDLNAVDIVICPPFPIINVLSEYVDSDLIKIGAQDCHFENFGAYTGDVSVPMLKDVGCKYVILGHSERRSAYLESNSVVKNKANIAILNELIPIVCVGETLEERESGEFFKVIESQLQYSLPNNFDHKSLVIAYEPVWAIGTGKIPTLDEISYVHKGIRDYISSTRGKNIGEKISILYGGSLKPEHAKDILSIAGVDGGLIGGSSLKEEEFFEIINVASISV